MNAKDYLSSVQVREEEISEQQDYIIRLKESLTSIGCANYSDEKVQSYHENDKIGKIIAQVIDEECKLKKMEVDFVFFRTKIINQIYAMPNRTYRSILMKKYVDWKYYRNLDDVAKAMSYSYDRIRHLHSEALHQFCISTHNST